MTYVTLWPLIKKSFLAPLPLSSLDFRPVVYLRLKFYEFFFEIIKLKNILIIMNKPI